MSKKFLMSLAVLALVLGVSVSTAQAQDPTIEQLLAQIAQLQQQLLALQGGAPGGGVPQPPLTVGSTGEGVRALQQWLNNNGYRVAASGAGSPGQESTFFGELTKAALARYQAASGISPALGYYGPITYNAILASGGGAGAPPACPPGQFDPLTGQACPSGPSTVPGCQSGDTYSRTTGQRCDGGTTPPPPGAGPSDGKLVTTSVSLESSPADGTDIIRNRPNVVTNIVRWKLKVSNSDGILRQFGIKATHRPWLYWSKAALYDGDTLIAEKDNLTSADFTEVTSGSDYRLVFAGLNHPLAKDANVFITLRVNGSTDSGRAVASSLVVTQASNSITVEDANDPGYFVTDGNTSNRNYDFVAASVGNIVPSSNTATPGTRWVKVSESGTTPKVTLYVFDLKAENRPATITSLNIGANTAGDNTSTVITSFDLYEGSCPTDNDTTGCTLIAGGAHRTSNGNAAASASSSLSFTSLTVDIPADTKKTFTIKGLLADEDDFTADAGSAASTTVNLSQSDIAGHDDNFDTLTVSGNNVTSNDIHAILKSPTLISPSLTMTLGNPEYIANLSAVFSLKANGGTLYISRTPNTALATSSTASTTLAKGNSGLSVVRPDPDTLSCDNDSSSAYCIQDGDTRKFTFTGALTNQDGQGGATGQLRNFKITRIFFDDNTTNLNDFFFDATFTGMSGMSKDLFMDVVDRN